MCQNVFIVSILIQLLLVYFLNLRKRVDINEVDHVKLVSNSLSVLFDLFAHICLHV